MSANAIGATPDSTPLADLADVDLLDRVRHGDDDAFVVLWRRHLPAAQAVAVRFRGRVAPEDLVAEASARMLRLLREGAGPRDNFRAYFTSTVRTVGVDAVRRDMSALPTDAADLDQVAGSEVEDEPEEDLGSGLVREAFARLPERERQLLWMTMVDGAAPRAVAPRLGVSANLVSVRVMRAKEALRGHYLDVWVQHRSTECASPECRWTLDHLSAHVRGRSTPRRHAKVEAHLASCPRDAALADNLRRISTGFAGLVLPFLVAGASQALGSGVGQGAGGLLVTGGAGLGGASGIGAGAAGGASAGAASAGAAAAGAAGAAGAATGALSGGVASGASTLVTGVAAAAGGTGVGGAAAASSTVAATVSTAGAAGATTVSAVATGAAASGVVSGALASGAAAAALVPVAVAAGGATIGGLTISPPVATAVAGIVIGLGVAAPAVVLTHGTNEHSVVQQHPSSSTRTPRPGGAVGPSSLPDLGSVVGGAVGGVVVAPVVSATVPVAPVPVSATAAPTSTVASTPTATASATADPAPEPSTASPSAPAAADPAPAPTASAPAEQQSTPESAGVVPGDTASAPASDSGTPAGAPAADSGSGAPAPAPGG